MPASTNCIYEGRLVSIQEALIIREQRPSAVSDGAFICIECGNAVRPHQSGGQASEHFEHFERHSECSLSHKGRFHANPDWVRDELILALDFYLKHRPTPPDKFSAEIAELSAALKRLGSILFPRLQLSESFRNANGVHMKLMNFRRLDPQYTVDGKKGLSRGGKEEETVWKEFANDPARCDDVARAILTSINNISAVEVEQSEDYGFEEAPEGRVLTRKHLTRERNRKLTEAKRKKVLRERGKLECEVCGFDFSIRYGLRGDGFIECHHTKPVATLSDGSTTNIKDLALVCANCHRMVHRRKPWLTIEELKEHLGQAGK